jgi:hypothetical protein
MPPDFETILDAMRRVAAILRDAEIPFALAGGVAVYAWGGADTRHDVDFLVRESDVAQALDRLAAVGFWPERPPEGWLVKAYDESGTLIDLIFRSSAGPVDDAMLARAETLQVHAIDLPVLTPTDVLIAKLLALDEHRLDLAPPLEIVRALREQIDWAELQRATADSPFAAGFVAIAARLGFIDERVDVEALSQGD